MTEFTDDGAVSLYSTNVGFYVLEGGQTFDANLKVAKLVQRFLHVGESRLIEIIIDNYGNPYIDWLQLLI